MSRSKAKGTAAETAVVRFLRAVGFTQAERRTLGGTQDRGDIAGVPGVVIEVTVRRNADGSFDALFIAIEDRGDEDEVEIKGTVVSATDTSVTVQRGSEDLTVQFDHETEFKGGSAKDLVAGQKAEIEAIRRRDGTLLAKKIEIED